MTTDPKAPKDWHRDAAEEMPSNEAIQAAIALYPQGVGLYWFDEEWRNVEAKQRDWIAKAKIIDAAFARHDPAPTTDAAREQWRDIATAPKDQKILLWVANGYLHGHVKTGIWETGLSVPVSFFDEGEITGYLPEKYARYWQPLPAPPMQPTPKP